MVFIRHEYQGMSATPLPIQPATPQINTPSPSPQRNSQRDSDASFDARLNDAQRQRASSDDDSSSAKTADTARDSHSDQSSQASNGNAQAASKSAASAAVDAAKSSSATDNDNDSNTSSVASLANSVLSLIDQATGDSAGDSTGAGPKSAAGKSLAQSSSNGQTPHTPPQPAAIAPLPPPPVPQTAAASKGGAAQASADATNSVGAATSPIALQNAINTTKGDGADADADDDTDTTSAASFGNAVAQAATDSAQALAATAMTAGHAVLGTANATPSTNSTPSTPDFASLRGALDATAVSTQPAGSTSAAHNLSNDAPVGSSGFAKELGHQVTWLSGQEVKQAQIRLNPENLGPLDVKVSVEHGRVDVAFTTQHPETTAAVQQGLDQLNQMLGGQGLSLGHTTVGQHGQQQFAGSQQQGSSQTSSGAGDAGEDTATSVLQRVAVGLVDAFA
jgi:flagellar hook-length control protein FliK